MPPYGGRRTLGVDVDPLPVLGHVGERADARLVDGEPLTYAELLAVSARDGPATGGDDLLDDRTCVGEIVDDDRCP